MAAMWRTHKLPRIHKLVPGLHEHEMSLCKVMAYLLCSMSSLNGSYICHVLLRVKMYLNDSRHIPV